MIRTLTTPRAQIVLLTLLLGTAAVVFGLHLQGVLGA